MIKHKLIIPIRNTRTTISEILNSIKKDIQNKFGISEDCNIIKSELGENGQHIEYSQEPAHTVFKPSDTFYIRPVDVTEQTNQTEHVEDCECPVCYSEISTNNVPHSRFFQCSHSMCHSCYENLRIRVCPMCRAPS